MDTKISGLSRLNVDAIDLVWPNDGHTAGAVTTTATTATFHGVTPAYAARIVQTTLEAIPGRTHPRASLWAVVRRLKAHPDFNSIDFDRITWETSVLSSDRRAFLESLGNRPARHC